MNRPRGLCFACSMSAEVRSLYPSTSKYARRGVSNFAGAAPLPDSPTTAAPGTPEKVAVMAARAAAGCAVFHPDDAGCAQVADLEPDDVFPTDPFEYEVA